MSTSSTTVWTAPSIAELQPHLPQYLIESQLGQGGMGAVYQARQTALDRPVAIKVLPTGLGDDDSYGERFSIEARSMARLTHPGIVAVYDFGQTPSGLLYYVMEFVDGTDVHRLVSEQGRLSPEQALAIAANVCEALAYAHANGVVHRDIKPANILISRSGQVKIADFGLARMDAPAVGLTHGNLVMGSPDYVAPEALIIGMAADHRADIYAVGVMLYYMLTAEVPRGIFEMPSKRFPGLDPRFDAVLTRAMQTDREKRYPNAQEMEQALTAIHFTPTAPVLERLTPPSVATAQSVVRAANPSEKKGHPPLAAAGTAAEGEMRPVAKGLPLAWFIPPLISAVCILGASYFFRGKMVVQIEDPTHVSQANVPRAACPPPANVPQATIPPQPAPSPTTSAATPSAALSKIRNQQAAIVKPIPSAPSPLTPAAVVVAAPASPAPMAAPHLPPELVSLRQQYDTALAERVTGPAAASHAVLAQNYLAGLERAATTDARLAAYLPAERQLLAARQPLPAYDTTTPASLNKLRAIYRTESAKIDEARNTAHLTLISPYITRLRQLETDLTKASRIPDALAVKDYRDSLSTTLTQPAQ